MRFFFFLLALFSAYSFAFPSLLSLDGFLTNSSGSALNGSYSFVFALYNVSTGGTAIWTETQTLTVSSGKLNALLGSVTALSLPFDQGYYLGVTVSTDSEMSPRYRVASSAYSYAARTLVPNATVSGGLYVDGKLRLGNDAAAPSAGAIRWSGTNFEGFDGSNWRLLDFSPAAISFRYLRITLQGGTSGVSPIQVAEFQLYDPFRGDWLVNNMTSANAPSPKVVNWTATSYSSSAGWKIFDGTGPSSDYNNGYMTSSANATVAIDFGANVRVSKYRIWTSTYSDGGGTYRPNAWKLEASNDTVSWSTIDTRTASPVPAGSYLEFYLV